MHGMTGTRTHGSWRAARERCNDPNNKKYFSYGGRGISFHPPWNDFAVFLAEVGVAPDGFELDRIDGSGNYEPGNVRWASRKQQMQNTGMTIIVVDGDRRICLTDFAEEIGAPYQTLRCRARKLLRADRTVEAEALLADRGRRLSWSHSGAAERASPQT